MTMINELSDDELKAISKDISNNKFQLLDIREKDEFAREHIPHAINMPLSQIGKTNMSLDNSQPVIVYCRLGSRTKTAMTTLSNLGFQKMYCLSGGIEQWKRCGMPVYTNTSAPLEIMRQVQIIVGVMILAGLFLAYFVSPYFIALTIIAGIGMLVAGITGFCGMAKCLMFFPWNSK